MNWEKLDFEEKYNMDRVHTLKTWPKYWDGVCDATKTFEVRKDDRGFQVGDTLELLRWNPETGKEEYTTLPDGTECSLILATVTYVLPGGSFGIAEGFCVLGLGNKTVLKG